MHCLRAVRIRHKRGGRGICIRRDSAEFGNQFCSTARRRTEDLIARRAGHSTPRDVHLRCARTSRCCEGRSGDVAPACVFSAGERNERRRRRTIRDGDHSLHAVEIRHERSGGGVIEERRRSTGGGADERGRTTRDASEHLIRRRAVHCGPRHAHLRHVEAVACCHVRRWRDSAETRDTRARETVSECAD